MIIKLVHLDKSETHFDVQNRQCGYPAQLVMWNHQIYTLVPDPRAAVPTYQLLPPIPKIESHWHCLPPERVVA